MTDHLNESLATFDEFGEFYEATSAVLKEELTMKQQLLEYQGKTDGEYQKIIKGLGALSVLEDLDEKDEQLIDEAAAVRNKLVAEYYPERLVIETKLACEALEVSGF